MYICCNRDKNNHQLKELVKRLKENKFIRKYNCVFQQLQRKVLHYNILPHNAGVALGVNIFVIVGFHALVIFDGI
ncbi:MAG: hypothetical protein ACXWFB_11750 [Nitrososphaeraceae archaeon]